MEQIDAASLLEIANETLNQSSMRFDPSSGLYYDQERDMYYDIHSATYYDYKTGVYYKMDEIECLVEVYRDPNFKKPSAASEETVEEEKPDETVAKSIESSAVEYDPSEKKLGGRAGSIRAIVTRCRMTSGLETGALHLVTIDGCTIGSAEGNDLRIIAEDVEPFHCWISYSSHRGFLLTLNAPLHLLKHPDYEDYATPLLAGTEVEIKHECSIEIGYTVLELHSHPPSALGQSETCDGCEPGLRKAEILRQTRLAMPSSESSRKESNREIRKLCGVSTQRKDHKNETRRERDYRDRAAERRTKFGIDSSYAKDEVASTSTEIPKSNIGRKLMEKAGWKSGEGLGKGKQGITTPIVENSARRPGDQSGIGAAAKNRTVDKKTFIRNKILSKTAERYYSGPTS